MIQFWTSQGFVADGAFHDGKEPTSNSGLCRSVHRREKEVESSCRRMANNKLSS